MSLQFYTGPTDFLKHIPNILAQQGYQVIPEQRKRPQCSDGFSLMFLQVTDGTRVARVNGTLDTDGAVFFYIQSPWRWTWLLNPRQDKEDTLFRAEITACLLKAGARLDSLGE